MLNRSKQLYLGFARKWYSFLLFDFLFLQILRNLVDEKQYALFTNWLFFAKAVSLICHQNTASKQVTQTWRRTIFHTVCVNTKTKIQKSPSQQQSFSSRDKFVVVVSSIKPLVIKLSSSNKPSHIW